MIAHSRRSRTGWVALVVLLVLVFPSVAIAAPPVARDDGLAMETAVMAAADSLSADRFGYAVAISGDTAIVGAFSAAVGDVEAAGAAYVFTRSGETWQLQQRLVAADGAAFDAFGAAVAIDGDTAIVGANGADGSRGAAYVFVRSGAIWRLQQKIAAADGAVDDGFGAAVALDGGTALVGCGYDDLGSSTDAGSAYVFTRSGAVWTLGKKLVAPDAQPDAYFGSSVALDGGVAVVGASGRDSVYDEAGFDSGAAYVFAGSGSAWTGETMLVPSAAQDFGCFGSSVAISGDTVVAGAWGVDDSRGAAYVFRHGTVWSQEAELVPAVAADGACFGYSVAVSGDIVVAGAPWDDGAEPMTGGATVFARSAGTWAEQAQLRASDGVSYDGMGVAVAAEGDQMLVGADWAGLEWAGATYAFTGTMSATTLPGTALAVAAPGVLRNDSDPESSSLSAELVTNAEHGSVVLAGDGSFTYTPAPGWIGTDHFHYRASDGAEWSGLATAWVRVVAATVRPMARADVGTVPQDGTLAVAAPGLLANDDGRGRPLTALLTSYPEHGSVEVAPNGGYEYVPDPDWYGTDHFQYVAHDGRLRSTPATVTITVTHANSAPTAVEDREVEWIDDPQGAAFSTFGHGISVSGETMAVVDSADFSVQVLARKSGAWVREARYRTATSVSVDGDTMVVGDQYADGGAGNVAVYTRSNGVWLYNGLLRPPVPSGSQAFGSSVALDAGTVVVGAIGEADVVRDRVYVFRRTATTWVLEAELSRPASCPHEMFGYSVALSQGTAVVGAWTADEGAGAAYVFTRRPLGGWVSDGRLTPTDRADQGFGFSVAVSGDTMLAGTLSQEMTPDSGYLYVRSAAGNWNLRSHITGPTALRSGYWHSVAVRGGTAVIGWHGDELTTVLQRDRTGGWTVDPESGPGPGPELAGYGASAAVSSDWFAVGARGFPMSAQPRVGVVRARYRTYVDTVLNAAAPGVLANDTDPEGDPLSAEIVTSAQHGSVTLRANGSFTYTPDAGWSGLDHFHYRVFDGRGYSDPVVAWVSARKAPVVPTASPDLLRVSADTTLTVAAPGLLCNDTSSEGGALTAELVSDPASGTVDLRPDGSLTYRPGPSFRGTDSFMYRARDGAIASVPTLVRVEPALDDPMLPVHRFYNFRKGVHFYTANEDEKRSVEANLGWTFRYEGVSYRVNTANVSNGSPLYRFYNTKKGVHFYTASEVEKDGVLAKLASTYRLEGVAYTVCTTPVPGATPVHRFFNFRTGVHFYTANEAEKADVQKRLAWTYRYEGVAYYLAP